MPLFRLLFLSRDSGSYFERWLSTQPPADVTARDEAWITTFGISLYSKKYTFPILYILPFVLNIFQLFCVLWNPMGP
jgi:hypothetical protein